MFYQYKIKISFLLLQNAPEPCQSLSFTDASFQSNSLLTSYQKFSLYINNIETRSKNHEAIYDTNITNISLDHTFAIRESPKELKES